MREEEKKSKRDGRGREEVKSGGRFIHSFVETLNEIIFIKNFSFLSFVERKGREMDGRKRERESEK